MDRYLGLSIFVHLLCFILAYYGVPHLKKDIVQDYAIVMEVVPISELTNIQTKREQAKATETKATPAVPAKLQEAVKEPVKEPIKEPEKKLEPKKEENLEKIPDKQKEKLKDLPKKPQTQKPEKSTKETPPKDKKKPDIFNKAILKNNDTKSSETQKKDKINKEFDELVKGLKAETNKDFNQHTPMSISEIDAVRSQIQKAWNTAAFSGAKDLGMEVIISITLDKEANVLEVRPILKNSGSPYYQSFVDSAIRAVKIASPIKNLPPDKYQTWKEMELRFDSSGMIY